MSRGQANGTRNGDEGTAQGAGRTTAPLPLKLRARDAEDLHTIAACLQDALVPVTDIAYLRAERRFVMVANRFRWERSVPARDIAATQPPAGTGDAPFVDEGDEATEPPHQRVNCGICFDSVTRVRVRGFDPRQKDQILNLLTVHAAEGAVTLIFSGGAEVRLEVARIRCHLEDLGEPWPTRWRPSHDEAVPLDPDEPDTPEQDKA
ncbi:MAG: DUF2948 family protein [Alphaproteobacteria bacterium]|nr:MAG: DUF2948 family protein [Alphaproteobacteria bacterium]